jgi:hypothetical protein
MVIQKVIPYGIIIDGRRNKTVMEIVIHPRISKRHPDLNEEDVREAWDNFLLSGIRAESKRFPEVLRVGHDRQGRELEMVGALLEDGWLVFHAMTPPSKKTLSELDRIRRNRT